MQTRIKELRKRLGLSQNEFAKKLDLKQGIVSCWELGTQEITPSRITQICQTFNVRREWLENGEEPIFYTRQNSVESSDDVFIKKALDIILSLPDNKRELVIELAKRLVKGNE